MATTTITANEASVVRVERTKDKLIAKFNTQDLLNISTGKKVSLLISGKFNDGTTFEGTDTIRLIQKTATIAKSSMLASVYGAFARLLQLIHAR